MWGRGFPFPRTVAFTRVETMNLGAIPNSVGTRVVSLLTPLGSLMLAPLLVRDSILRWVSYLVLG